MKVINLSLRAIAKQSIIKIATAFGLAMTLFLVLFSPLETEARDASKITDWYIKDFQSDIIVNTDSSLLITEEITADCGNLPDKHGIFRTLPTYYQKSNHESVDTPIALKSITDFSGNAIKYSESKSSRDSTITWKIGDPNKTVTGENYYKITYLVKNTIRFNNSDFDEFYWNLSGNFWQIDIDSFHATIHFPEGINRNTVREINLYSGQFNTNDTRASYKWLDDQTLEAEYVGSLTSGYGITLSATFPKNIITPYKQSPLEKYGMYLFFLLPLVAFFISYKRWKQYGKDPKLNRPIMAEYDIPDNLAPLEFGVLHSNGQLLAPIISAAIINLAVKKCLKIEQIPKTGMFGKDDFKLIRLTSKAVITQSEKNLLDYLFSGKDEVKLSELKNKFYTKIRHLRESSLKILEESGYFDKNSLNQQTYLMFFSFGIIIFGVFTGIFLGSIIAISLIISGFVVMVFGCLMAKRTPKGAETYWKIKGFELFIEMTEKYRQQFNEKENIFEKFLPYAMIFGLTKIWVNNMKKIYGEEYFTSYHPVWFYGPAFMNFNADTFNSMISDLSKDMSSTIASNPSSSGAGGGGFSGGGGGGGGGGGW